MTQLLYSDATVDFLAAFARDNEHRPEILLSFGFVPKVESQVGLINWLIQDRATPPSPRSRPWSPSSPPATRPASGC